MPMKVSCCERLFRGFVRRRESAVRSGNSALAVQWAPRAVQSLPAGIEESCGRVLGLWLCAVLTIKAQRSPMTKGAWAGKGLRPDSQSHSTGSTGRNTSRDSQVMGEAAMSNEGGAARLDPRAIEAMPSPDPLRIAHFASGPLPGPRSGASRVATLKPSLRTALAAAPQLNSATGALAGPVRTVCFDSLFHAIEQYTEATRIISFSGSLFPSS